MIRKMFISSVLLVALLVTSHAANARAIYTINVEVNGDPISLASGNTDSSPYIEQETGTAYVPLRFVSQNLGGIVSWDRSRQQVTIVSSKGVVTTLTIGSTTAYVNKQPKVLSDAPVLLNYPNRVIVPLRFVSEVLGATVDAKKADDGFLNVNITMSK